MFKKICFIALGLFICTPFLAYADGGWIIFPPQIHINEAEQNAIVAWNGEEEVLILSIGLSAGAESTVLKIIPLPANPSEIKEGDFRSFEKLTEVMNAKTIDYYKNNPLPPGSLGREGQANVEITFHEKIGAHDITVAKVNGLDEFIDWVKKYLGDNNLGYYELSDEFKSIVSDYTERNIKHFVFDIVEANQTLKSVNPVFYRFPAHYLIYPNEISAFSDVGKTDLSRVRLFLITDMAVNKQSVLNLNFQALAGFQYPIILNRDELAEVHLDIANLFKSGAGAYELNYSGRLYELKRDLVIADLIRARDTIKVYQVVQNKRLWVPSPPIFNERRFNWTDIREVSRETLDNYPDIHLIRASDTEKVYYLDSGGLKRHIPTATVFRSYNFAWEDIVEVSPLQLNIYRDTHLIRCEGGQKVYLLENGTKRWIQTAQIFKNRGYKWSEISLVNLAELNSYPEGVVIE